MDTDLYDDDHRAFRQIVREYIARAVTPHLTRWEQERRIDRKAWQAAGQQGLLGLAVPEEYGGAGQPDYRFRAVIAEELADVGASSLNIGLALNEDIVLPYLLDLCTPEQKQRWLPGFASGETISAIAMTEPDAGSDLRAIRTTATRSGDEWVINGSKTFITNGIQSDLVIVVARTSERSLTLFVVEGDRSGFTRGRQLDKMGLHAQDTAEIFFDDVRVPAENVLGAEGRAFAYLMERLPKERMLIAVGAQAASEAMLRWTTAFVRERKAFGQRLVEFQTVGFTLAELQTEIEVTRAYIDKAILALNAGTLGPVDAAKAKWWASEMQNRVAARCFQLHGGYGYMMEYPIARAFVDARVQTIYGGTTEIMKEIISREIVGPRTSP
ncbi:acyl-CoA dehydrogenase family protein [Phytoactinopolyspora mesophila]|uniref:Acyl-[acyl-carrier-protein] dehydrogenase MbtN n=1 Tax=Phytoactinopolyspora mesophila TaxID=2650750 RepID=A0A7K3M8N5_9ACTN|nr:acyl-CoA dehydrogenase [Phytoactinopolyspora mesophila]